MPDDRHSQLEIAILIGLQASGKSSFYRAHLAATHVQVSKDLFPSARNKARRQRLELEAALDAGRSVVVDNTNLTRADRADIVALARTRNVPIVGYYFASKLDECLVRNASRSGRARVPDVALRGSSRRLEMPDPNEGFSALWYVTIDGSGGFVVEPWECR